MLRGAVTADFFPPVNLLYKWDARLIQLWITGEKVGQLDFTVITRRSENNLEKWLV